MKTIHLHTAAADNAGQFVDAGNDLEVGDQARPGYISEDRAKALVASHGARAVVSAPKPRARPAARRGKPAAKAKAAPKPEAAKSPPAAAASAPASDAAPKG